VKNNHCLKEVEKCMRKNFLCLRKIQCLKKARVWQHETNCKYTKDHHILQILLDLAGAQVPGNENNYFDSEEKQQNSIYNT